MSTAAKLKKRAIELEQKKQLDRALALYIQFLQESEGTLDDVDIPLYNRVGDLLLRSGNVADALSNYEKAVDLYAERGFLNNAIALCNKVLRQAPGRASIYYKLGRISATKGFKSDAKKNFLEYADRMQKVGHIDEAFRALKEFADLCPDQDDIRLMLAEQLSKENRQDEALEQLQRLHDKLDSEGRMAEARATVDRMKSIDPEAVPRTSGSHQPQKTNDLIFLDTSFERTTRSRQPATPPPAGRQVSDPDLVVLTLADQADTSVSPVDNAAPDGFGLDLTIPGAASDTDDDDTPNDLPLLDVPGDSATPAAGNGMVEGLMLNTTTYSAGASATPARSEVVGLETAEGSFDLPSDGEGGVDLAGTPDVRPSLGIGAQADPPPMNLSDQSRYVSGTPLGVDYAADLLSDGVPEIDTPGSDLFDFRAPPRSDDFDVSAEPPVGLDPDVAFPSLNPDDISLPSADDVTSGASLAIALGNHPSLGSAHDADRGADVRALDPTADLPPADALVFQADPGAMLEEAIAESDSSTAREGEPGLELAWPALEDGTEEPASATAVVPAPIDEDVIADIESLAPADPEQADDGRAYTDAAASDVANDDLEATWAESAPNADHDVAKGGGPASAVVSDDLAAVQPAAVPTGPAVDEWQRRRERAERLLEAGDRISGIEQLDVMSADLERAGDLERALTIVDELIRLQPDSIRHHQKRVELAFRVSHRPKLIDAYIELGDALFRSGEERKARVVYQRVLELAPDDARARAALDSVVSASPPAGSGAIPTVTPISSGSSLFSSPTGAQREPNGRPVAEPHQPPARRGNGISAPPTFRRPSPLDRSAANGDFVDLGDWLRSGEVPKSTRMVAEEKPPSGDEQADFQEMLKRFKQGVAENVDEEDYESHYDLGVAYKEMGLMDEAVAEFQKSLRGTAHRVRAYEALGQCFVEKQQYHVASSVLARAMALGAGDDHHLVGVLYLMGRATEALDRPGDALDYYQRVFAVDIEFRDVAERISAIERKAT